jgi:hypothetical protein
MTPTQSLPPVSPVPKLLYLAQVSYLVILFGLALAYADIKELRAAVPDPIGPVPLGVIWFGALGGAVISIDGAVKHRADWDPRMTVWHYMRPLVGMALGTVSYLIFVVVVAASGARPVTNGAIVYYLVAFVVAYREETFRNLIKRATDVLLASGGKSAGGSEGNRPG